MKKDKAQKAQTKRINVVLSIQDYEKFGELCKQESRSRTNFASILIRRYIQEMWNDKAKLN